MGWSYTFWRGNFYPESLPSKEFLSFYAKQFSTVEVDSTFYRVPNTQTLANWIEQTSKDFIFCPKFPRVITHVKMLKECQEETRFFLKRIELLGSKLGPLLLQMPPTFNEARLPNLEKFLQELPKGYRFALEVRNKTLLDDTLYSILKDNNVSLAWIESQSIPTDDTLTSDFLYIRWEGDRNKVKGTLGKREIDVDVKTKFWAKKIRPFLESNMEVFGFFSKYFSGNAPADAREFMTLVSDSKNSMP
jgi:uncharacterized protein YecE (DUF72 family)